jgi:hypothetical protein
LGLTFRTAAASLVLRVRTVEEVDQRRHTRVRREEALHNFLRETYAIASESAYYVPVPFPLDQAW